MLTLIPPKGHEANACEAEDHHRPSRWLGDGPSQWNYFFSPVPVPVVVAAPVVVPVAVFVPVRRSIRRSCRAVRLSLSQTLSDWH
jgi:hypothetical protein